MTIGIGTCPRCLSRVAPLPDGRCPACRAFNFNTEPSDERTVRAAILAAKVKTEESIRRAAVLHWRVVGALGAAMAILALRTCVRLRGTAFLGEPPLDPEMTVGVLSLLFVVAGVVAGGSATSLSQVIRLASAGRREPGVLTVLRESSEFFRENHVPVGLLGPRRRKSRELEIERTRDR
jgi:hypothetical protein